MERATMPAGGGMVARALEHSDAHVLEITASQKQRTFIADLVENCKLLETNPERFPDLYGDVKHRWPDRRTRHGFSVLMAAHCRMMDTVDRRTGLPRRDGSVFGRSYAAIAKETGLGDPSNFRNYTYQDSSGQRHTRKDWRGRRKIGRLLARAHLVGYFERDDRKPEQRHLWTKQKPRNERFLITEGPWAGRYRSYPTVRKVGVRFLERLHLSKRWTLERDDAQKYRRGRIDHFVDVQARRRRDREIKQRQRNKARELRLYYAEERQAMAAKTAKKTE